ncbi:MAG: NACHT domain-containing protein, partial [Gammaproteobacteria bacterium]|nr:NACHT domain-containing protein [Gammaproteobacteria bacterium]
MNSTTLPIKNKSVKTFIDRCEVFLDGAAGTNRGEIQKWFLEGNKALKRAFIALKKEQEICTIMHPQDPQILNSFFYVPKISERNSKGLINPLDLVLNRNETGALISGRLGQGKSMFLRYLQFLELNKGNTIPIFLDLHKIKTGSKILYDCMKKVNDIGLECSRKLFNFLLGKGHISIFLDGYDEIQFDKRKLFDEEITKIINSSPNNKIFITSRYDTEIERLPGITGYDILEFTTDDHGHFIRKIIKDKEKANAIMRKISEAEEFDPTVLDTPLLLTWFLMVYKVKRKIPKTKIGFYEELFKAILSRHDGTKDSLDRPSKSRLTDDEIEKVLHAFCYITSQANVSDFEEKTILKYITKS